MNEDEENVLEHIRKDLDARLRSVNCANNVILALTERIDDVHRELLDWAVWLYVALSYSIGQPPTPTMLLQLGAPGAFVHAWMCRPGGIWGNFRRIVARRQSNAADPTTPIGGDVRLGAAQERIVFRALQKLPGISKVEPSPQLRRGSQMQADFRVSAPGRNPQYVEVATVCSDPTADDEFERAHRQKLLRKLVCYEEMGSSPVVLFADDLAVSRRLTQKLNEVAARLGVAPLPLPPPMWFELASLIGETA